MIFLKESKKEMLVGEDAMGTTRRCNGKNLNLEKSRAAAVITCCIQKRIFLYLDCIPTVSKQIAAALAGW